MFDVPRHFRAWTNNTHLSQKDIQQLRKLIQLRMPQYMTYAGDPRISTNRDLGYVSVLRGMHRSEFMNAEWHRASANTNLAEKNRTCRIKPDGYRDRHQYG